MPLNFDSKENKLGRNLTPEEEIKELEKLLATKKKEISEKEKIGKGKAEKIKLPEIKQETKAEKEASKEAIKEKLRGLVEKGKEGFFVKRPAAAVVQITDDAAKIKKLEAEQQVKKLTELAFHKGIYYAIEVVKNIDEPYLVDRFHDALVNEFYNRLIAAKKLKQI